MSRPLPQRWVGIDCGYSQMSIAVVDASDRVLAVERTRRPAGDGHDREVALARLKELLRRVRDLRGEPVRLAGYCYGHAGVHEAFEQEGWTVAGSTPLNDVVGVYGLTGMEGHAVVFGCGSWPQVVYVDRANNIVWPGEDVADRMPERLPSGWAYADFLAGYASRSPGDRSALARAVEQKLGEKFAGTVIDRSDGRWGELGPLLSAALDLPGVRQFLSQVASAVLEARDVFWQALRTDEPPSVVMGGGAVRDDRLWAALESELESRGVRAGRVTGEHAVGLVRYAKRNPGANAWSYIGKKPSWLSG